MFDEAEEKKQQQDFLDNDLNQVTECDYDLEYTYQSDSSDEDSMLRVNQKASSNIFLKSSRTKIDSRNSEKRPRSVLDELEKYWQKKDQS